MQPRRRRTRTSPPRSCAASAWWSPRPWAGRPSSTFGKGSGRGPRPARPGAPRVPGRGGGAAMDAVAAALGDGPDSAAALSRAPRRVAFARLRPFLKHALLSDSAALRDTGFAQALHARLVRLACAGGALAAPAAELVADCLPWYRGVPRGSAGAARRRARRRATPGSRPRARTSRTRWRARFRLFLETELSSDAVTLASAAARAAGRASRASPSARRGKAPFRKPDRVGARRRWGARGDCWPWRRRRATTGAPFSATTATTATTKPARGSPLWRATWARSSPARRRGTRAKPPRSSRCSRALRRSARDEGERDERFGRFRRDRGRVGLRDPR